MYKCKDSKDSKIAIESSIRMSMIKTTNANGVVAIPLAGFINSYDKYNIKMENGM